jgi:hypothetical protein
METAEGAGLHEPYAWETDNNAYREHCLREARAAIEAMRGPTEAMILANSENAGPEWSQHVIDDWNRMLAAALTTSPST